MITQNKIALVGAGNIGGTLAHLSLIKNLGNVVLFDIVDGLSQGKALDLAQTCPIDSVDYKISGTSSYDDLEDSDVVIVTAGLARKPGMTRDDLLSINSKIMKDVGTNIKRVCPDAFVICITNPLDVMVRVLQHYSGLSDHKIVGMAGVLDSARFSTFLAWEFGVSVQQIQAYVMGGHGDTMVPLTKMSNIAGISLEQLLAQGEITKKRLDEIISRTKYGGGEIVGLLKSGSAYYAPAASAIKMTESYLQNRGMILPCATKIKKGMYNVDRDIFLGVPSKITSFGVKPVEIEITSDEFTQLQKSIDAVIELNSAVDKLLIGD